MAWICLALCTVLGGGTGILIAWDYGRLGTALLTVGASASGILLGLILVSCGLWKAGANEILRLQLTSIQSNVAAIQTDVHKVATQPRDAPRPMGELEATLTRGQEKLVRANIQAILDELAVAKQTIYRTAEDDGFWAEPIQTKIWDNARVSLAPERGVHYAYSAAREAYDQIREMNHLAAGRERHPLLSWETGRLERTAGTIQVAENSLMSYLTDLTR